MGYRHNGQAYVDDVAGSDISRDSHCDRASSLEYGSLVHCSELKSSSVDHCHVYDTRLNESAARNSVLCTTEIEQSVIFDSFITGATINQCALEDCLIRSYQGWSPRLFNTSLKGVVVDGMVELRNVHLSGSYYIHDGTWDHAPRAMMLEGSNGISVGLTECTEGRVHIGQRCHSVEQWLRVGPRLGRLIGWSTNDVAFARLFIESLTEEKVAA